MSLFKLGTIGAILHAKNNPRVQCASDVKLGYAFKITDGGTNYDEEATACADAAAAKTGDIYVVMNIIDKPELQDNDDFVIKAGDFIRSYRLDDLIGYTVEMSSDLVTTDYADVDKDAILAPVPAGTGAMKWVVDAAPSGYAVALKVLEKTTFGGTGLYCKIVKVA